MTAVACGDDDSASEAAAPTSGPTAEAARDILGLPEFADLEPGSYSIDPDGDPATPLRVIYTVAAEGWSQWIGAVKEAESGGHVAVSITTVSNLVKDGCLDQSPAEPPVGPTVDDLATSLSGLAPFVVSSPPSEVTMFGYEGMHLELTVPDLPVVGEGESREFAECDLGELHSWIATNLGGSFYGYNAEPGRTEELWILDVDGTRLTVATNSSPSSPPQDVEEMQAVFDSIRIEA